MNFFVVYMVLLVLFFCLLLEILFEEFVNFFYIVVIMFMIYIVFVIVFCIGVVVICGSIVEFIIFGIVGVYLNVGYMGLGFILVVLGE